MGSFYLFGAGKFFLKIGQSLVSKTTTNSVKLTLKNLCLAKKRVIFNYGHGAIALHDLLVQPTLCYAETK